MIAIVDGGSSKCDWVVLEKSGHVSQKAETIGFNPNMMSPELIPSEILKNPSLCSLKESVEKIFFYGSGCGNPENALQVQQKLEQVFSHAQVSVKEDLTAAAYAVYNGKPAVVCILGTGSNSCYFNGNEIRRVLPSLGFILGDEGSGTAIGKQLLRRFFMKKLPQDLHREFAENYGLTPEETVRALYRQPRPNAFLANFNTFVAQRKAHPYFQEMVAEEMSSFFEYHVLAYPEAQDAEISFVGSIAQVYEDILQEVAKKYGFTIGRIVQKPIEGLVAYHKNYLFKNF